jgi:hypothetical protein
MKFDVYFPILAIFLSTIALMRNLMFIRALGYLPVVPALRAVATTTGVTYQGQRNAGEAFAAAASFGWVFCLKT